MEYVIARYKEDIEWTKKITNAKIYIYDKGSGQLPNVGREAHTYIYHIVKNYENISDVTIFLQGDPFLHLNNNFPGFENISQSLYTHTQPFFTQKIMFEISGFTRITYMYLFGKDPGDLHFSSGAQWVVMKNDILSRPKEFYAKLLHELSIPREHSYDGVINAWTMETMWPFIFNPTVQLNRLFYEK
jgi:hypothetical protein